MEKAPSPLGFDVEKAQKVFEAKNALQRPLMLAAAHMETPDAPEGLLRSRAGEAWFDGGDHSHRAAFNRFFEDNDPARPIPPQNLNDIQVVEAFLREIDQRYDGPKQKGGNAFDETLH